MSTDRIVVRIAAAAATVVMIVVAFAVRGDDSDEPGRGDDPDRASQILCPSDLRSPCTDAVAERPEALATASAGATADALIAATDASALDGDAWIVPAAWAHSVVDERARLGRAPLFAISEPLVSSPVSMAIWASRAEELQAMCEQIDWACLADRTGTVLAGGDRVTTGAPDVDTALGLPIAAAQIAGLLGTDDYASNDFGAIAPSTARLVAGQRSDPLGAMRAQGPGRLTAVAVVDAQAPSLSSSFGPITLSPNRPTVRVDMVALTVADDEIDADLRDAIVAAFREAGWDAPDTGGATDDGLPTGGVLAAVRTLWNQR